MLVREDGFPNLNAFGITEGKFVCSPTDYELASVSLLVKIMHHPSGTVYGSVKLGGLLLSETTMRKLQEFLRSAEEDIGRTLRSQTEVTPDTDINNLKLG